MKSKILTRALCALVLCAAGLGRADETVPLPPGLDAAERAKLARIAQVCPAPRQLAWQRLERTAFFHFGINTFTDREWGTGKEDPKRFNPTKLDCRQWIRAIKVAGFKLAILTAKHHDGFCLWPSKLTTHSVASSPWKDGKGDVVRAFVDACRAEGIRVGLYLSPWDRHEPTYGTPAYNDFFVGQLKELFDDYGPIDEIWFDGACGEGPNGKRQVYDWARFYTYIRARNPACVIAVSGPDVRWVGNESGLARESEWSVLPVEAVNNDAVRQGFEAFHFDGDDQASIARRQLRQADLSADSPTLGALGTVLASDAWVWYPAECDVSIRPGWFYHPDQDGQVKSLAQLMDIHDRSVGRNAVLLLNIPPTPEGLLHANDVARLREFGQALRDTFGTNLLGSPAAGQTVVTLPKPVRLDVIVAQEDIAHGQVVERFHIDIRRPGADAWETVASATTIGHKRILRLKTPMEATALRIVIDEARATPRLLPLAAHLARP